MSDFKFLLDFDRTSVLELKLGTYIQGERGLTGSPGDQGPPGTLTEADQQILTDAVNAANESATASASSAGAAATSANASAGSATAAGLSATQAGSYAQQAAQNASAAASSATAAAGTLSNVQASATAAQNSATAALASQTAAAGSASAAGGSAGAAQASQTAAAGSASAAAGSATAAGNSATAAAGSATAAQTSANAAAGVLAGALVAANNLSDVANAATARTNLDVVSRAGDQVRGQLRVGLAASFGTALLEASNNQSGVGTTPAARYSNGVAGGPSLSVIPNCGPQYFNPIVASGDVVMLPQASNLTICPSGLPFPAGMRMSTDGNISVGITNITGLYNGTAASDGIGLGADHGLYVQRKTGGIYVSKNPNVAGTWDASLIIFVYSGVVAGTIYMPDGASVVYGSNSDYRIKTVVGPITDGLARACALPVYRGYFNASGPATEHDIALAHEIAAQYPFAVIGEKDAVSIYPVLRSDYDPYDVQPGDVIELAEAMMPQQVDYAKLTVPLFAAVQELKSLLDAALVRIAALESA